MTSKNSICFRTPSKMNNQFNSEYKEAFNLSKNPKYCFREYSNLGQTKLGFNKPNIHHSFMNSLAPFNYYINPANKNTFLINYNGGPQKQPYTFIKRDDLKTNLNDQQIIYNNFKPCGCLSQNYIPKLSRNLSYNQYFKYNDIDMNKNQNNNYDKVNFSHSNNNFKRYNTPNHFRMTKDGKIILTLKKFRNEKNNEDYNIRYENQNKIENNEKNDRSRNIFYSSLYNFRPRLFNKFHKTQIFNQCKPFLVDEFKEFPD